MTYEIVRHLGEYGIRIGEGVVHEGEAIMGVETYAMIYGQAAVELLLKSAGLA